MMATLLSLSIFGCSIKNPSYTIEEGIVLTLTDVLTVSNEEQNTVYYYYLMTIDNNTDKKYDVSSLIYEITDDKEANINAIDQNTTVPMSVIKKGQTGYIAGYVGFPNNNQKNIGLYFPKEDKFFSFKNIKDREATNSNVRSKQLGMAQTLYENDDIKIGYDYSQMDIQFSEGKTILSNFQITYENKTNQRVVVPFVTPYGTLNGLLSADYPSLTDYSSADIGVIQSLTYKDENVLLKDVKGESSGYALWNLDAKQTMSCNVTIEFANTFICYPYGDEEPFSIELICTALGVDRTIKLPKSKPQIEEAVNGELIEQKENEEVSE